MRRSIVLSLAAGLTGLALASPAAADTPEPASYFFDCNGPTKVQNLEPQSWSTTAPETSFTAGAGCGSADPGLLVTRASIGGTTAEVDFFGGGTHTGPIHAINVELHSLLLSQARVPPTIGGAWELTIDGEQVVFDEESRIGGELSETGLTEKYTFAFVKRKPFGAEEAPPLAAGDGEHTVEIRFTSRFLDYQNLWVWGASEVPAGVTINPEKPRGIKIYG